eukprot:scaffold42113_cov46-Attheya_sp.AAC.2
MTVLSATGIILVVMTFQSFGTIWTSHVTRYTGLIYRDYSRIHGIADLAADFVEPKCFGGKKTCSCADPMEPKGRPGTRHWSKATHLNAEDAVARQGDVDVVFLGDSITEGWRGTSYGNPVGRKEGIPAIFKNIFTVEGGGKYEGLALGIAGDTSPNLLYRLQNGELPANLNPSVFWLLIGTNDLGVTWCSAEYTLIGILRVVEEIRIKKPGATVVINALLPRTFHRHGYLAREQKKELMGKSPPRPCLWDAIQAINKQLKGYSENHEKVEFFETDVFYVDKFVREEDLRLDKTKMNDYLHPSVLGYELWGTEIAENLKTIIN